MNTPANTSSRFPPALIWIAVIAVTLFCAVGIAAIMGWIPSSMGGARDNIMTDKSAAPDQHGAARPAPGSSKPHAQATARPAPVPLLVARHAAAKTLCDECGVIESTREVTAKGTGTGIGAVGGAVVGGLLGNQVGAGRGQDIMTVVGAVGGAVAGNEVEKRVKSTKSHEVTVRLDDGSSRVFSDSTAWRVGEKVKIVNGVIQANI